MKKNDYYPYNPLSYTRCQETVQEMMDDNRWPVTIGGFAAGGLDVSSLRRQPGAWKGHPSIGVGGLRKFWTLVFGTWTDQWRVVFGGKTGRS